MTMNCPRKTRLLVLAQSLLLLTPMVLAQEPAATTPAKPPAAAQAPKAAAQNQTPTKIVVNHDHGGRPGDSKRPERQSGGGPAERRIPHL